MTTKTNARNARNVRKVRGIARMSINEGNADSSQVEWTKAKSLEYVGGLGEDAGKGALSQGDFAKHLVDMGERRILSPEGNDAKQHYTQWMDSKKSITGKLERSSDANKGSQCKHFLRLGMLASSKVNPLGLIARVDAMLTKHRDKKGGKGIKFPKQTFAAYLDVAKAQQEDGIGSARELTDAEIFKAIMPKEDEAPTAEKLWQKALDAVTLASEETGKGADMAKALQGFVAKLAKKSGAK